LRFAVVAAAVAAAADGINTFTVPTAYILGGPEYFISKVISLINFPSVPFITN